MKKTCLIIDSTAYIDKDYAESNNIKIVPLSVELNGKVYTEGFPGTYDDYFEELENSKSASKTSQPPIGEFQEAYEESIKNGYERIIVLIFSSELSGTYNSAYIAANNFNDVEIKVIDTYTAAGVFKYMIEKTVKMINEEKSTKEIEDKIKIIRDNSSINLTVESIDYLRRGGRLTNIQAMVASMLNIKPIVSLENGRLIGNGKIRGKKKALNELIDRIEKKPTRISVNYVQNIEEAKSVREILKEKYKNEDTEIILEELGMVIGSHLGPGGLGICTVYREKE